MNFIHIAQQAIINASILYTQTKLLCVTFATDKQRKQRLDLHLINTHHLKSHTNVLYYRQLNCPYLHILHKHVFT